MDDILKGIGWCFASTKWKHPFQWVEAWFPMGGNKASDEWKQLGP